jgi:hypothetical protein
MSTLFDDDLSVWFSEEEKGRQQQQQESWESDDEPAVADKYQHHRI